MATLKCNNCGKSVKANEELVDYTEIPGQPIQAIELTATCSCGAQLRKWRRPNLTDENTRGYDRLLDVVAEIAANDPEMFEAAQRKVWEVEGF